MCSSSQLILNFSENKYLLCILCFSEKRPLSINYFIKIKIFKFFTKYFHMIVCLISRTADVILREDKDWAWIKISLQSYFLVDFLLYQELVLYTHTPPQPPLKTDGKSLKICIPYIFDECNLTTFGQTIHSAFEVQTKLG